MRTEQIRMEMTNIKTEQIYPSSKASDQRLSGHVSTTGRMGADGKICRKRSRASKRTPTTVLNTDTSNFKAMVQHFTGAPSHPNILPPSKALGGYDFFFPNKSMDAPEKNIYASSTLNVAAKSSSSSPYDFPPQTDMSASFMNFFNDRPDQGHQNYITDVNSTNLWDEVLRSEYPASALFTHIE